MLDATAIEAIRKLAQDAIAADKKYLDVLTVPYSTVPLHDLRKKEPEPAPVVVATLSGFVDFLRWNIDGLGLTGCQVHVVAPDLVRLESALVGHFQQRFSYAEAKLPDRFAAVPFGFGRWLPPETLIIALQALFADAGDRAAALSLLGNLRDEFVKNATDDGVSQAVSVKAGIVMVGEKRVPNPVQLAPFRTFDEVEQPIVPFVLRLRKDDDQIEAALFEADGGAWRTEAVRRIAAMLRRLMASPTGADGLTVVTGGKEIPVLA